MTYLIDSDWVIDWLANRRAAVALLRRLSAQGICVSLITYAEVLDGVYHGQDVTRYQRDFQRFLQEAPVLPLTRLIMQRFARIRGDLRLRGAIIPDMDLLIAATALHHDLTLVTRNVRHFERVPALKLLRP